MSKDYKYERLETGNSAGGGREPNVILSRLSGSNPGPAAAMARILRLSWARIVLFVAVVLLGYVLLGRMLGLRGDGGAPLVRAPDEELSGKVQVEVYYEVLCPDSRHFVVRDLHPAWEKVGNIMDVHLKPYGKTSHTRRPDGGYDFQCQHGPPECAANMVHACALELVTRKEQLMEYVRCMMSGNYDGVKAGQECADQLGIDWAPIQKCASGIQGQQLLATYGDQTHALNPRVTFIPTVVIDGSQRNQRAVLKNFMKEVCEAYQGEGKPAGCSL